MGVNTYAALMDTQKPCQTHIQAFKHTLASFWQTPVNNLSSAQPQRFQIGPLVPPIVVLVAKQHFFWFHNQHGVFSTRATGLGATPNHTLRLYEVRSPGRLLKAPGGLKPALSPQGHLITMSC